MYPGGKMTPQNNPSVSVIIPVYNNAAYIGEAIESVLQQTWTCYEIIIVDDGSTDQTEAVVKEYLDQFANILFVRQENRGPGPARNAGIKKARGKWIAFLDADDVWVADKLEKQVAYLKEHPNTFVAGAIQRLAPHSDASLIAKDVRFFTHAATKAEDFTKLLKIPYLCAVCGLGSLLIGRDMLDNVGLFDESLKTVEDDDLIFRLFLRYRFHALADVVLLRRKHSQNMTTTSSFEPRIQNKYKVTKKILALINDGEITEGKQEILGYWTEEFVRRYIYNKNYSYALRWLFIGLKSYPHYYTGRIRKKVSKICNGSPERNRQTYNPDL